MSITCNQCGFSVPDDSLFCPKCGNKIEVHRCANCGRTLKNDEAFCPSCGTAYGVPAAIEKPSDIIDNTVVDDMKLENYEAVEAAETDGTDMVSWNIRRHKWYSYFGEQVNMRVKFLQDLVIIDTTRGKQSSTDSIPYNSIERLSCVGKVSVFYLLLPLVEMLAAIALFLTGHSGYGFAFLIFSAISFWDYSSEIYRQELVITQADGKKSKLAAQSKDKEILHRLQSKIAEKSQLPAASVQTKDGHGGLKIVLAVITGLAVILALFYLMFEQLYLIRLFPKDMMASDLACRQIEIMVREQLDTDADVSIRARGSSLVKATAMPDLSDDGEYLIYFYVTESYFVTISALGEEKNGFVEGTGGFMAELFAKEPAVVEMESISCDEELLAFFPQKKLSQTEPVADTKPASNAAREVLLSKFVGEYSYDDSFTTPAGTFANFYYLLSIEQSGTYLSIHLTWRGNDLIPETRVGEENIIQDTISFKDSNGEMHDLQFIPASRSALGIDTIIVDGDNDMPYTREGYASSSENTYVPSGNAWDGITVYGSTYEEAVAAGWGDEWMNMANQTGTEAHYSDGYYDPDPNARLMDFVLNCDKQYYSRDYLNGFDAQMAILARNAPFAHAGRKFNNDTIRSYFNGFSWYRPLIEPDAFKDSMLNVYEKANMELVVAYEKEMGYK